jgi:hypothetical protein
VAEKYKAIINFKYNRLSLKACYLSHPNPKASLNDILSVGEIKTEKAKKRSSV